MTKQAVLEQGKQLSKDDQIYLAMDLWDLVDTNSLSLKITPEFAAELDRRIADGAADQSPPVEWKVLREQLLRGEI